MMAGKPSPRSNYHLMRIIINRPPQPSMSADLWVSPHLFLQPLMQPFLDFEEERGGLTY